MGLYATPFKAKGISIGITKALKITADKMALSGLCNRRMFSACKLGMDAINNAGTMAKYLATSLAIENVVNVPLVMSNCLPISTISISLEGQR